MSMKKVIPFVLLGLIVGIGASSFYRSKSKFYSRNPAAQAWQGKHQRLFEIQINPVNGIPPTDEQDLVLKAQITALAPLNGEAHFQWLLPDGGHVVAGELQDSVLNFSQGQLLEKEISIQGVSLEGPNKIVTLQLWTDVDGVKMGGAGVFATKPEEVRVSEPQTQMKTQSLGTGKLPDFIQQ